MLTRNDLLQISQLLDQMLDQKLSPIQNELEKHGKILEKHGKILENHGEILMAHGKILEAHGKLLEAQRKILDKHGKMLASHSRLLKSLKKDQNLILAVLDQEQMNQRKRLDRVEDYLHLPTLVS